MKSFLAGFLSCIVLLFGIGAISTPPMPKSLKISSSNVTTVQDTTVPDYFRLTVSEDNKTWEHVGDFQQSGVTNATWPVLQIRDGGVPNPHRSFAVETITKAQFDSGTTNTSVFGTGIIVFRR